MGTKKEGAWMLQQCPTGTRVELNPAPIGTVQAAKTQSEGVLRAIATPITLIGVKVAREFQFRLLNQCVTW